MKNIRSSFRHFLLLIALLTDLPGPGLGAQNLPIRAAQSTLLDVPTPAHDRAVEVFFPISGMPQRPYLHLAYLSTRRGMSENSTDLVIDLQRQTQLVGGDAVIVLNSTTKTEVIQSFEWMETVDVNTMSGLAIIYPENLQFVPGQVKAWQISTPDTSSRSWQVAATRNFDMKGNSLDLTGEKKWFDWWYNRQIISFAGGGAYRREDSYGRIRSLNSPSQQRRMVFTYEGPGASARIVRRKIYENSLLLETHHFHFTEDKKQVAHIEIAPSNLPHRRFLEFTETDAEGRVTGYLYLVKEGGQSAQYLRVDFVNYTLEEWEEVVKRIMETQLVTPK